MTQLPKLFHLQPIGDFRTLPLGSEFDVVYCPEVMTDDGWVMIHFKTVDYFVPHTKAWSRCIAQLSKTPISETEAARLWEDVRAQDGAPLEDIEARQRKASVEV